MAPALPPRAAPRASGLSLLLVLLLALLGVFCRPAAGLTNRTRPLDQIDAEIIWDSWGVPHIFANSTKDLSFAYGYAQARDHGQEVIRFIATARGRASEYWGAEWIESDALVWANDIPNVAEDLFAKQHPETVQQLEYFAAGFNHYFGQFPDDLLTAPFNTTLVMPVSALDIMKSTVRIHYFYAYWSGNEKAQWWSPSADGASEEPDYFRMANETPTRHYSAYVDYLHDIRQIPEEHWEHFGSNAWAMNGPKVAPDVITLLNQNPHLPFVSIFRWYEAHFVIESENVNLYGAGILSWPNLQIAFNDYVGWTHTVNIITPWTVYEVELSHDNSTYLFDGVEMQMQVEEFPFKVLLDDGSYEAHTVVVEKTIHGHVVNRKHNKVAVLRRAGADRAGYIKQWWDMGRARSMAQFRAAIDQLQLASLTVVAASADGSILNQFNGFVPVRSFGDYNYWNMAVPGNTSRTFWTELHPLSELPHIQDPASGWVHNANESPWTATFPLFLPTLDPANFPAYVSMKPYMSFRPQVSVRLLHMEDRFDFDTMVRHKHSTLKEAALHYLDELLEAIGQELANRGSQADPRLAEIHAIWTSWDRTYDAVSPGSFLFEMYLRKQRGVYFLVPWLAEDPLNTPHTLSDLTAAVESVLRAADAVAAAGHPLDASWGDMHKFYAYQHTAPPEDEDQRLVLPAHGTFDTFRSLWWKEADIGPYGGDSYTGLLAYMADNREVDADGFIRSRPIAATCMPYGNATPGSRGARVYGHVNDQFQLFADKALKPALRERKEILADQEQVARFDGLWIRLPPTGA
ncbi:hypothetical protein H696_00733 [Fonticula alba]|uniref:Penicillin amidase n=1 Tax=Fonticula alba TaxID=691883 RepID=A0A058ZFM3_FONAL|nr:hypothetical protein H696_00733 [Fonticula alba]KCV73190.1 hypothetical protein H696_00733 [Fonticula alba]|eukprot:XP_009492891.1 hypothetical protein H696_00733 [Fonticula alba]